MLVTAERKRDGGIETPAWWPARATQAKRDLGLSNDEIAALAARSLGVPSIDPSRVSRCLSGYTATIPLLGAISDVLGIPSPVIVAESEVEADRGPSWDCPRPVKMSQALSAPSGLRKQATAL